MFPSGVGAWFVVFLVSEVGAKLPAAGEDGQGTQHAEGGLFHGHQAGWERFDAGSLPAGGLPDHYAFCYCMTPAAR